MSLTTAEVRNDLAHWYPRLRASGVRVPRTEIVTTRANLVTLLHGEPCPGFDRLCRDIQEAVARLGTGYPAFLRTGHGSGKHEWRNTCYLARASDIPKHVANLVEWSELVDILGLPTRTWAVREFLPLVSAFHAFGSGLPIAVEVRCFARDGQVESVHGYWPPEAIEQPSRPDWREVLGRQEDTLIRPALPRLRELAGTVASAFAPEHWSVDFALLDDGDWVAIDMAEGDRSFRNPRTLWTHEEEGKADDERE